jgi:hypothetical protein
MPDPDETAFPEQPEIRDDVPDLKGIRSLAGRLWFFGHRPEHGEVRAEPQQAPGKGHETDISRKMDIGFFTDRPSILVRGVIMGVVRRQGIN